MSLRELADHLDVLVREVGRVREPHRAVLERVPDVLLAHRLVVEPALQRHLVVQPADRRLEPVLDVTLPVGRPLPDRVVDAEGLHALDPLVGVAERLGGALERSVARLRAGSPPSSLQPASSSAVAARQPRSVRIAAGY